LDADGKGWRSKIEGSLSTDDRARVHFQVLSRDELAIAYQQAAVCILPSTWENSPYALLEAMSCATPVVACDSGGTPELIENGVNGFLIPVDDAQALAARVGELLSQSELRKTMGRNARLKIEQTFSVEKVLPKMMAAYDYAIAN
jgi:glycosyltransferase involved in cell wall biosynthesis